MTRLAQYLFALAMAGFGLLNLIYADFALQWQPFPAGLSSHHIWAYASGILLLAGGVALILKPTSALGALVLGANLLIWVVVLQGPVVAHQMSPKPETIGAWLPLFEDLAMMCGAWLIYSGRVADGGSPSIPFIASGPGISLARFGFAIACLVFGASHLVFAEFTSQMIPAWMPQRLWLAYLTGAGHLAAGIAILTGILPRLAAALEALMMSSFVVLVHIPMVMAGPAPDVRHLVWTMLCAAAGLSASAFAAAGSLSERPWGLSKP